MMSKSNKYKNKIVCFFSTLLFVFSMNVYAIVDWNEFVRVLEKNEIDFRVSSDSVPIAVGNEIHVIVEAFYKNKVIFRFKQDIISNTVQIQYLPSLQLTEHQISQFQPEKDKNNYNLLTQHIRDVASPNNESNLEALEDKASEHVIGDLNVVDKTVLVVDERTGLEGSLKEGTVLVRPSLGGIAKVLYGLMTHKSDLKEYQWSVPELKLAQVYSESTGRPVEVDSNLEVLTVDQLGDIVFEESLFKPDSIVWLRVPNLAPISRMRFHRADTNSMIEQKNKRAMSGRKTDTFTSTELQHLSIRGAVSRWIDSREGHYVRVGSPVTPAIADDAIEIAAIEIDSTGINPYGTLTRTSRNGRVLAGVRMFDRRPRSFIPITSDATYEAVAVIEPGSVLDRIGHFSPAESDTNDESLGQMLPRELDSSVRAELVQSLNKLVQSDKTARSMVTTASLNDLLRNLVRLAEDTRTYLLSAVLEPAQSLLDNGKLHESLDLFAENIGDLVNFHNSVVSLEKLSEKFSLEQEDLNLIKKTVGLIRQDLRNPADEFIRYSDLKNSDEIENVLNNLEASLNSNSDTAVFTAINVLKESSFKYDVAFNKEVVELTKLCDSYWQSVDQSNDAIDKFSDEYYLELIKTLQLAVEKATSFIKADALGDSRSTMAVESSMGGASATMLVQQAIDFVYHPSNTALAVQWYELLEPVERVVHAVDGTVSTDLTMTSTDADVSTGQTLEGGVQTVRSTGLVTRRAEYREGQLVWTGEEDDGTWVLDHYTPKKSPSSSVTETPYGENVVKRFLVFKGDGGAISSTSPGNQKTRSVKPTTPHATASTGQLSDLVEEAFTQKRQRGSDSYLPSVVVYSPEKPESDRAQGGSTTQPPESPSTPQRNSLFGPGIERSKVTPEGSTRLVVGNRDQRAESFLGPIGEEVVSEKTPPRHLHVTMDMTPQQATGIPRVNPAFQNDAPKNSADVSTGDDSLPAVPMPSLSDNLETTSDSELGTHTPLPGVIPGTTGNGEAGNNDISVQPVKEGVETDRVLEHDKPLAVSEEESKSSTDLLEEDAGSEGESDSDEPLVPSWLYDDASSSHVPVNELPAEESYGLPVSSGDQLTPETVSRVSMKPPTSIVLEPSETHSVQSATSSGDNTEGENFDSGVDVTGSEFLSELGEPIVEPLNIQHASLNDQSTSAIALVNRETALTVRMGDSGQLSNEIIQRPATVFSPRSYLGVGSAESLPSVHQTVSGTPAVSDTVLLPTVDESAMSMVAYSGQGVPAGFQPMVMDTKTAFLLKNALQQMGYPELQIDTGKRTQTIYLTKDWVELLKQFKAYTQQSSVLQIEYTPEGTVDNPYSLTASQEVLDQLSKLLELLKLDEAKTLQIETAANSIETDSALVNSKEGESAGEESDTEGDFELKLLYSDEQNPSGSSAQGSVTVESSGLLVSSDDPVDITNVGDKHRELVQSDTSNSENGEPIVGGSEVQNPTDSMLSIGPKNGKFTAKDFYGSSLKDQTDSGVDSMTSLTSQSSLVGVPSEKDTDHSITHHESGIERGGFDSGFDLTTPEDRPKSLGAIDKGLLTPQNQPASSIEEQVSTGQPSTSTFIAPVNKETGLVAQTGASEQTEISHETFSPESIRFLSNVRPLASLRPIVPQQFPDTPATGVPLLSDSDGSDQQLVVYTEQEGQIAQIQEMQRVTMDTKTALLFKKALVSEGYAEFLVDHDQPLHTLLIGNEWVDLFKLAKVFLENESDTRPPLCLTENAGMVGEEPGSIHLSEDTLTQTLEMLNMMSKRDIEPSQMKARLGSSITGSIPLMLTDPTGPGTIGWHSQATTPHPKTLTLGLSSKTPGQTAPSSLVLPVQITSARGTGVGSVMVAPDLRSPDVDDKGELALGSPVVESTSNGLSEPVTSESKATQTGGDSLSETKDSSVVVNRHRRTMSDSVLSMIPRPIVDVSELGISKSPQMLTVSDPSTDENHRDNPLPVVTQETDTAVSETDGPFILSNAGFSRQSSQQTASYASVEVGVQTNSMERSAPRFMLTEKPPGADKGMVLHQHSERRYQHAHGAEGQSLASEVIDGALETTNRASSLAWSYLGLFALRDIAYTGGVKTTRFLSGNVRDFIDSLPADWLPGWKGSIDELEHILLGPDVQWYMARVVSPMAFGLIMKPYYSLFNKLAVGMEFGAIAATATRLTLFYGLHDLANGGHQTKMLPSAFRGLDTVLDIKYLLQTEMQSRQKKYEHGEISQSEFDRNQAQDQILLELLDSWKELDKNGTTVYEWEDAVDQVVDGPIRYQSAALLSRLDFLRSVAQSNLGYRKFNANFAKGVDQISGYASHARLGTNAIQLAVMGAIGSQILRPLFSIIERRESPYLPIGSLANGNLVSISRLQSLAPIIPPLLVAATAVTGNYMAAGLFLQGLGMLTYDILLNDKQGTAYISNTITSDADWVIGGVRNFARNFYDRLPSLGQIAPASLLYNGDHQAVINPNPNGTTAPNNSVYRKTVFTDPYYVDSVTARKAFLDQINRDPEMKKWMKQIDSPDEAFSRVKRDQNKALYREREQEYEPTVSEI